VENIFKSKLENYTEQPPQAVWNKINEKRTPLYIWWNAFKLRGWKYAASILLLAVSGLSIYFANVSNNDIVSKKESNPVIINKKDNAFDAQQNSEAKSNTSFNDNVVTENSSINSNDAALASVENIKGTKIRNSKNTNGVNTKNDNGILNQNDNFGAIDDKQPARNIYERIAMNKLALKAFVYDNKFQFYPNLLPYNDLYAKVINIIEPVNENQSTLASNWYMSVTAGPMLAARTVSGDETLKSIRDNSEKSQIGWDVTAKIGKSLGTHWEIESGFQLMQRRESLNYKFDYTTIDQELKITDVKIYHPNLDPVFVQIVDTLYKTNNHVVNNNRTNTYTYLSIPLIARYNYYFPKNWSINAAAGLLTDVYKTNNALVMANDKETIAIDNIAKTSRFNQRVLLSAGLKFKANKHWSILAEPVAVFGVSNMMNSTYSLKQKEFGFMFNSGLRYNF
jgi:hypothetical protein